MQISNVVVSEIPNANEDINNELNCDDKSSNNDNENEKDDDNENEKKAKDNSQIKKENVKNMSENQTPINDSSSTQSVSVSQSVRNNQCRYCFNPLKKKDSVSSCKCNGLLCFKCLENELILTSNRQTGVMKCTACNEKYKIKEVTSFTKIKIILYYLYYVFYHSFPFNYFCIKPLSWFYIRDYPPSFSTFISIILICIWILFTTTLEWTIGEYLNGMSRALIFFIDIIVITQMYTILQRIYSKRIKNGTNILFQMLHISRIVILTLQAFYYAKKYGLIDLVNIPDDEDNAIYFHANEIIFSVQWLTFVSSGFFMLLAIMFWVEITQNFKKDFKRNRKVMIGKYGPFQIGESPNGSSGEEDVNDLV